MFLGRVDYINKYIGKDEYGNESSSRAFYRDYGMANIKKGEGSWIPISSRY